MTHVSGGSDTVSTTSSATKLSSVTPPSTAASRRARSRSGKLSGLLLSQGRVD